MNLESIELRSHHWANLKPVIYWNDFKTYTHTTNLYQERIIPFPHFVLKKYTYVYIWLPGTNYHNCDFK